MSEKYEIQGRVKHVGEMETIGAKGFTKREIVITTPEEKYPQDIKIDFVKDGCAKLDDIAIGDDVTIAFNIRGSEWKEKYFVNLQGWKIDKEGF